MGSAKRHLTDKIRTGPCTQQRVLFLLEVGNHSKTGCQEILFLRGTFADKLSFSRQPSIEPYPEPDQYFRHSPPPSLSDVT
jgi:hypothetical protein